jgi:outer membrane protein OmpA-like peptidoglycan-associated protein
MPVSRSCLVRRFAGTAVFLSFCAMGAAQSHDPNKPTPLGPGVNKGNVDNKGNGPNYYYLPAGPGHVDVHYAFHEMGVFGNPFKQVLNFDILDEKNALLSHDAVQSIGKLETYTQPGNLERAYRLIIRVSSPDAPIRLGGYYEIEATGAVRFEGKATGGNAKPEVHPGGPLTGPPTSLTGPQTSLTGPPTSLTGPPTSLTGPQTALTSGTPVALYQPIGALTNVQESPKELRLTLAADILFDFDRATIRPDAKAALDRVAEIIRKESDGVVRIEGFTDAKGPAAYNLQLSNARAESVERQLSELAALPRTRFAAQGLGATRFVAPNTKGDGSDDPAGRQKNRRVEIVIQKKK